MKRLILSVALVVAGVDILGAAEKPYWLFVSEVVQSADWRQGYMTDGKWKLKAQVRYGEGATKFVALGNSSSWGAGDANSYCWKSGEGVLDLSKPIYEVATEDADPSTGVERPMNDFPARVFENDTHVTSLILPKAAREFYTSAFANCTSLTNLTFLSTRQHTTIKPGVFTGCSNLKSLTADCPGWTSIPTDLFASIPLTGLTFLTLRLPQLTTMPASVFKNATNLVSLELDLPELTAIPASAFENCPLCLTDATKWNLPKVESVGDSAFYKNANSVTYTLDGVSHTETYPGPFGSVRLPSLRTIVNWAFSNRSRVERYELGSDSLVSIADNAFSRLKCREFVIGNSRTADLAIGNSFSGFLPFSDANISFRITGKALTATALANLLKNRGQASRLQYYTIHVSSRHDPAWKTAGDALTAEEQAGSPANAIRVAVAGCRNAWIVDEAMPGDPLAVETELDAPGWGVKMEADPAPDANGYVADGATVTLTLTNAEDAVGTFYRWYGDVGDGDRFARSVTFKMNGRDAWTMPVVDRPWTYDAAKGTITDGDWEIRAFHPDYAAAGELRVGNPNHDDNVAFGDAIVTVGHRILNLNGPITDIGGNKWTIRRFSQAMPLTGAANVLTSARSIVVPRTLNAQEDRQYFNAHDQPTLKTLIYDVPNLVLGEKVPAYLVHGQRFLRHLVLRIPVSGLVRNEMMDNLPAIDTDVGDWSFPDVTNVGHHAFWNCTGLRGTLALPKAETICANAFDNCAALGGVVLGTPKKAGTKLVGENAFVGCTSLKNVTVAADPAMTVAANAFAGCAAIENLTFSYLSPTSEAVANILAAVKPAVGDKPCRIWGSTRVRNTTFADLADAKLTSAELAAKPEDEPDRTTTIGVFRVAADGACLGRAWVIDRVGPYDAKGFIFILR